MCAFSDKSIPRLEDTMKSQQSSIDVMTQLIRKQTQFEKKVAQKHMEQRRNMPYPDPGLDCKPPKYETSHMPFKPFCS